MISALTRYLIIGLVLASAAAVGILTYKNQGLEGEKAVLTLERNDAHTKVKTNLATIATLEKSAKDNQKAHEKLLAQIANSKNLLSKHEQTISNLERENEQFKTWSITSLPAPVILLRHRPAITGSQSYRDWLSKRDTLSAPSNSTDNKR